MSEILYKFRDWNNQNHKKIITNLEIFFPSREKLNDPDDLNLPIPFKLTLNESWTFEKLKDVLWRDPTQDEIKNKINEIKADKEWMKKTIHSEFDQLMKDMKIGIFSTSKQWALENKLMRTHYWANHHWFCIWFNGPILLTQIKFHFSWREVYWPVKYSNIIPELEIIDLRLFWKDRDRFEEYWLNRFFLKYEDREYEDEYRFLVLENENKKLTVIWETISEIIFWLRMLEIDKRDIIKKITNHWIDVSFKQIISSNWELKIKNYLE